MAQLNEIEVDSVKYKMSTFQGVSGNSWLAFLARVRQTKITLVFGANFQGKENTM